MITICVHNDVFINCLNRQRSPGDLRRRGHISFVKSNSFENRFVLFEELGFPLLNMEFLTLLIWKLYSFFSSCGYLIVWGNCNFYTF